MHEPAQKCETNVVTFIQKCSLTLLVAFKIAYFCCFSLLRNQDFQDCLQFF